jgi:CHASE2 domain-containing sensor protein/signal transduction histidine kinase
LAGRADPFQRAGGGLFAEWLLLLVVALAAVAVATRFEPLRRLDNLIYDALLRADPRPVSDEILIIAIDNRSVAALGRWPWPRTVHARLIDRLADADVRIVGHDVLFIEPSADPAEDAALAAALARTRVVLPYAIEIPGYDGAPSHVVRPVPALKDRARLGHAAVRPDRDGIVRGIEALSRPDGRRYFHLAEEVARLIRDDKAPPGAIPLSGSPILGTDSLRLRFAAGPGGYPQASFVDVLEGRVPRELLQGRIILVGATAAGLGDRFATPMSGARQAMSGVELLANHIDSDMRGAWVRPAPALARLGFSMVPVLLLMASLLLLGPRINLWIGLALALVVGAMSAGLLLLAGLWLPPATALVSIALLFPLWGWRRLDFTNRYMAAELEALAREPGVLPRDDDPPRLADPVERQVALMHSAIQDVRDLRRFIAESLDSFPDAALVTDLSGRVLIANDAADALFGARLGRAVEGLPLAAALKALHGDDEAMAADARMLLAVVEAGTLPPTDPLEWELPGGLALDIRLAFFTDDARQPLGWILRLADVSALRDTERQREEALRLLTHDMRAPQASILAVLDAEGEALPAPVRRRIARLASQTLELADQYVQFARAGTLAPARALLDLTDAMLDAVDDLYPLARARGIEVSADCPEAEALVMGDRALLTRAIQNLIGNAIKYGSAGGSAAAKVEVLPEAIRFSVADTGRGIAADDLATLFAPFRRLAGPDGAPAEPGAGLGLAFVKRVIDRHGGEIFARSEPGRGSTFGFILPAARPEAPDQAAVATPAPAASARADS